VAWAHLFKASVVAVMDLLRVTKEGDGEAKLAQARSEGAALLSVIEAARRLNVSRATVYNLCASGELPHRRIGVAGGRIRFAEEDLKEYLERKRVGGRREQPTAPAPRPLRLRHLELS
jgi:excisionase family DNA binding protein